MLIAYYTFAKVKSADSELKSLIYNG